jgi:hypothetical protein
MSEHLFLLVMLDWGKLQNLDSVALEVVLLM